MGWLDAGVAILKIALVSRGVKLMPLGFVSRGWLSY
jgi:hypothetical protein